MSLFDDNLAALESRSPDAALRIRRFVSAGEDGAAARFTVVAASDGSPVLQQDGRCLDSRRNPADAARREAASAGDGAIVVAGVGSGYFVEALLDAGRDVAALVAGDLESLAAVMRARDLRRLLRRVPLLFLDTVQDPVECICLKTKAPVLAAHGGSVALSASLRDFVAAWPRVPRPTRPPKVMVVGPIAGGSLETARSAARAARSVGADTRFLDFAPFGDGWQAISRSQVSAAAKRQLHSRYSEVLGEVVLQEASAWRPDLLLALAQAPLGSRVLQQLRSAGVRTAFWYVENFRVLPYWKTVAPAYDTFFAIQREPFLSMLREAGSPKALFLPTACDAGRHVPVTLTEDERARYGADVSFAGAPYLNRRRLLLALTEFSPRLWGEGWHQTELAPFAANGGRLFSLPEMIRVFAGTRVNLNIHSAAHVDGLDPDPDYVNPRTFELAACGAFQLVDQREHLRDLFSAEEVVSFSSLSELSDRIRYYLAHDEERLAMAARSRQRALAEHTFEHRVREAFRHTLPAVLTAGALLGVKRHTLDEAVKEAAAHPAMTVEEAKLRVLQELQGKR